MEKGDIKLTPIMREGYFVFLDEATGEIFEPEVEVMNMIEPVTLTKIVIED